MKSKDAETLKWCTDACARCDHIQKPEQVKLTRPHSIRADYLCEKCSHRWFTGWDLKFAIEHALDAKYWAEHPD